MKVKYFVVVIILLLITLLNVKADTYYGNYYLVEEYEDNNNFEADELLIEEVKLYNTYKEEYIDMGYLEDNEEYLKDENDFIEEYIIFDNYIEYSDEYVDIGINNNVLLNINLIDIVDKIKINEIEVYSEEISESKKISYKVNVTNLNNIKNLYDKDLNTYAESVKDDSYLYIVLNNKYPANNLILVIYTDDIDTNISFKNIIVNDSIKLRGNKHIITFKNDMEDISYKYGKNINKYKYYKMNKVSTNNYVEKGENLILEDYLTKYNYYKRDKLVLKDEIILNNINMNIKDFIEKASGEVITNCNIDYNINGEYYCNFKLNDINVDKKVILDIPLLEVNNQNESIVENNNMIEMTEKVEVIKEEKYENNNTIENNNTEIKNTYKENNVIENEKNIEIKNNTLANNINKKNNKSIGIIKYIIIIIIILIEVILSIKKKKNKCNVESI